MQKIIIFLVSFSFLILPMKLIYFYNKKSIGQEMKNYYYQRVDIIDSENVLLATTISTKSIYIIPYEIFDDHEKIIENLSQILEMPKELLRKKMKQKNKFIWIKRHISPNQANLIAQLGYSGVYIAKDFRRFYPNKDLFLDVLGNIDDINDGISGIEFAYNDYLKNTKNGPLKLSLKSSFQYLLKKNLTEGRKKYKAKAAFGMLINAKTGQILAMFSVSNKTFDNPHFKTIDGDINLNVQMRYELGSIFKVLAAGMYLEEGIVTNETSIFAPAVLKIGKFSIKDVWMSSYRTFDTTYTFEQAFAYSSNVVFGNLSNKLGLEKQMFYYKKMGVVEPMKIDNLNVVSCLLPKNWTIPSMITSTYGYGIALTCAAYMRAFLRLISGKKMELHILNDIVNKNYPRIFKEKTKKMLLFLLNSNAKKYEKNKSFEGLGICGKTGTAHKFTNGKYSDGVNICSYVFAFPYQDPEYIGIIILDEPEKDQYGNALASKSAMPLALDFIEDISKIF